MSNQKQVTDGNDRYSNVDYHCGRCGRWNGCTWGWLFYQKKQSHKLQERFGPEYDRTVHELGSRTKESELKAREKRVERLEILPLAPPEAPDSLRLGAPYRADSSITPRVWSSRPNSWSVVDGKTGYPMGDFERRAGDISVDHPDVVANYRSAQAIALRDQRGRRTPRSCAKRLCTTPL